MKRFSLLPSRPSPDSGSGEVLGGPFVVVVCICNNNLGSLKIEVELWKVPLVTFLLVFVLTVLKRGGQGGKYLEPLSVTDLGVLAREESPWLF